MAAFTLVELLIGMAVTALVMAALAALLSAVAAAWRAAEPAGTTATGPVAAAPAARLQSHIRPARLIGAWRGGSADGAAADPAAMLLWMEDRAGDGQIQLDEVMLIVHAPADRRVYLHRPAPATQRSATQAEQAAMTLTRSSFSDPATIDWLRQLELFGPPHVLLRDIDRMWLTVRHDEDEPAFQRPVIEYAVRSAAEEDWHYGLGAVRAPWRKME